MEDEVEESNLIFEDYQLGEDLKTYFVSSRENVGLDMASSMHGPNQMSMDLGLTQPTSI